MRGNSQEIIKFRLARANSQLGEQQSAALEIYLNFTIVGCCG
jgi:hypothetical protein